ncbi:glycosyltransferase family 25 protein [Amniculicola lignicola CBS 123094]|uniref:Glycosyltransferase family 25 protein n=1 Tax=Amniculicola lignicola CBS 123094 TaxID=1392246 RepID=A0A6A5WD52_9PLEO|nr:glycosyltransferase family 25 protein [Amniculicola lignicola CBS 123094]
MISWRRPSWGVAAVFCLLLVYLFDVGRARVGMYGGERGEKEVGRRDLAEDVKNGTLGFQEIFVVNLPKRTDRKDAMTLAAAYTEIKLSWIYGLPGDQIPDVTLPLSQNQTPPSPASKGSWRAHLNAIQAVVEKDLGSALVMEDDVDWDLRLKDQLFNFSLATRTLIQPLVPNLENINSKSPQYADPSFPTPKPGQEPTDIDLPSRPLTIPPASSPYGDDWDILWLGHCGMSTPPPGTTTHPLGRIFYPDPSVPDIPSVDVSGGTWDLTTFYPPHTRLVHHAYSPVCSLVYAVSQRGARTILYELSIRNFTSAYDNMLRELCDGEDMREGKLVCLSVQPALWTHWRERGRRGKESDISGVKGWRERGESRNVRWSVRGNLGRLVRGVGGEGGWWDQWPD